MTQPKRSSSSSKRSSSKSTASSRSAAAKKAAATRKRQAAKRSAAAKKGAATRKAGTATRKAGATRKSAPKKAAAVATDSSAAATALNAFRDAVTARASDPINMVMISRDRLQESLDNAVERGHMTRESANKLAVDLAERGLREWQDLLSDMEQLLGRVRKSDAADMALQGVDKARRAVGVGASFPITGYDDLTAAQVGDRLGGLSPAELRKVRDYERRHGNRKSVLSNIEKALG